MNNLSFILSWFPSLGNTPEHQTTTTEYQHPQISGFISAINKIAIPMVVWAAARKPLSNSLHAPELSGQVSETIAFPLRLAI
jgi:hypothetical protein